MTFHPRIDQAREGARSARALPADDGQRFTLTPEPTILALRTDPPGAEIFLDGALKGITPLERLVMASEGSHTLFVRKKGYQPWSLNLGPGVSLPEMIRLQTEVEEVITHPSAIPRNRAGKPARRPAWRGRRTTCARPAPWHGDPGCPRR